MRVSLAMLGLGCSEGSTSPTNTTERTDSATQTTGPTAPAPFECGEDKLCTGQQYCEVFTPGAAPDTGGVVLTYTCVDAPAACGGVPSCACLATEYACADTCNDTGPGVVCEWAGA